MNDKVILVIDKPNACWECMLCGRGVKERFCIARIYQQRNTNDCDIKDLNKVESWCPLRPLPQKLEVKADTFDDIMHTEFQTMSADITDKIIANIRFETDKLVALGWNACLKEITGEEE